MRVAFVDALMEMAESEKGLFVITNDLGYSVLEPFIEKYPNQYLNVGIAEQNMVGVAAGLALSGRIPIIFSIIPFATMRCYEQVRDDICYHNLNIKIVGVGSGLAYGALGPTHHSIEDIAIMRALPNMTVLCPGDPQEAKLATIAACKKIGPVYIRIHKKGDPKVHKKQVRFTIGTSIQVLTGHDGTIIATGNMLHTAVAISEKLKQENGKKVAVISMHTIKPFNQHEVITRAKKKTPLFTLEEHSIIGGLGSAVAEALADSGISTEFYRLGIQDRFTKEVGGQEYLRSVNKLSLADIHLFILKKLQKKVSS